MTIAKSEGIRIVADPSTKKVGYKIRNEFTMCESYKDLLEFLKGLNPNRFMELYEQITAYLYIWINE